jgi:hypothetical protein
MKVCCYLWWCVDTCDLLYVRMYCYVLLCEDVLLCADCDYVFVCATMPYMSWYLRPCVAMCCFVWLSAAIYEDVLLCAAYNYVFVCGTHTYYELISETICYYVLICVTVYNYVWKCAAMWRCVPMCCMRLSVCMCDYALLWADIWDHLLLCPDLCDCL